MTIVYNRFKLSDIAVCQQRYQDKGMLLPLSAGIRCFGLLQCCWCAFES